MSEPHGYGVFGKRKHIVKIDHEMAERAFAAMYGVHNLLVQKESRSRRRKACRKSVTP